MSLSWGHHKPSKFHQKILDLHNNHLKNKYLKKKIRKTLSRIFQVYDVSIDGLKFRCHVLDNATERFIVFNTQKEELDVVLSELCFGDVFLDIGANCGLFSMLSSQKVGKMGRVIAVEPNPIMINRFAFNVNSNSIENIELVKCAVGDESGEMYLDVIERQMGQSSIIKSSSAKAIPVRVVTLLELLEESKVEKIDVMKIDIEGYEDKALVPFFESAPRSLWPKSILLEVRHVGQANGGHLALLSELGYQIKWKGAYDVLMTDPARS